MTSKITNKYAPEVRERAVRMVLDHERDHASRWAEVVSIAAKIGCAAQTLHAWVKKAEVDSGRGVGVPVPVSEALHPRHPLSADVSCEHRPEPVPSMPHGFMAEIDAAFEEQVFHVPQRQRIPDIHHHREADYLRRRVETTERTGWLAELLAWAAISQGRLTSSAFALTGPR